MDFIVRRIDLSDRRDAARRHWRGILDPMDFVVCRPLLQHERRGKRGSARGHHDEPGEPRHAIDRSQPLPGDVATSALQQHGERFPLRHVDELQCECACGQTIIIRDCSSADPCPLCQNLLERRLSCDERHAAVVHRELHLNGIIRSGGHAAHGKGENDAECWHKSHRDSVYPGLIVILRNVRGRRETRLTVV